MKLSCIVIDDEPLAVELMEGYVRKTPYLELAGSYGSGTAAFAALRERPVDLLFCDIQMPGLSGMELSRMLPEETRVIFTTAFSQYALEGFRVQALDYLLKPISYNDFLTAANKALQWFELKRRAEGHVPTEPAADSAVAGSAIRPAEASPSAATERETGMHDGGDPRQSLFVKTEYRLQQIPLERILYIEGLKDYVKIHVEGEARPVVSLLSLKTLEEELPTERFIRVHRSYIVQPSKIRTIERNRILFGEERIPISENYRQPFYDFLSRHALLPGWIPGRE